MAFLVPWSAAGWVLILLVLRLLQLVPPSAALLLIRKPASLFAHPRCVGSHLSSQVNEDHAGRDVIYVALTREAGNNDKFREALLRHFKAAAGPSSSLTDSSKIRLVELPCIAHANGPDYDKLHVTLKETNWDYVTITSPEAARVLASAWPWNNLQHPQQSAVSTIPPAVVAVGKATEKALEEAQIAVRFCPSKATAQVLVQELPAIQDNGGCSTTPQKILYPASAQAKSTLQTGLEERGFCVTRLDTYDTVTAVWGELDQQMAADTSVACFASPSAVKGWLSNTNNNTSVRAACIGETSAKECREQGWSEEFIFYPEKPGLDGWVQAVVEAANTLQS